MEDDLKKCDLTEAYKPTKKEKFMRFIHSRALRDCLTYALVAAFLVCFIVGIVFLAQIANQQKKINDANQAELQEAIRQRELREEYVKECVKVELETDSEVTLRFFKWEGYQNGYITHYVAEVDGKTYVVSATYVDDIVEVDVVSEI